MIGRVSVLLLICCLVACGEHQVKGEGPVVKEQRKLAPFDRVTVNGNYAVTFRHADHQSVVVAAQRNILPLIETQVTKGKLVIRKASAGVVSSSQPIRIALAGPECVFIHSYGSNRIVAQGLRGQNFTLKVKGAGEIVLSGAVASLDVIANGSSAIHAKTLQAKRVDVLMAGAGVADVQAKQALSARIGGVGQVSYAGNPKHVVSRVSGLARLRHV